MGDHDTFFIVVGVFRKLPYGEKHRNETGAIAEVCEIDETVSSHTLIFTFKFKAIIISLLPNHLLSL